MYGPSVLYMYGPTPRSYNLYTKILRSKDITLPMHAT